jgi:DNA modification methylase
VKNIGVIVVDNNEQSEHPSPYFSDGSCVIYNGDCADILLSIPENSIDAVVTDPPYGLSFMGKRWDYDVPSVDVWVQCLRVLKPGGHLLAFAGTRTQHRMAVRIEDAGFEIRDMIAWVYGSGFPKSMDVSKAIDKSGGTSKEHIDARKRLAAEIRSKREAAGITRAELAEWFPQYASVTLNWERLDDGFRVPSEDAYQELVVRIGISDDWRDLVRAEDKRRLVSSGGQDRRNDGTVIGLGHSGVEWAATTEAAKQWEGWGTALKPALEPITMARKPIPGTVADNVQKHGTGAINVDGCRIEAKDGVPLFGNGRREAVTAYANGLGCDGRTGEVSTAGRWPANLIHDGSEEVVSQFPETTSGANPTRRSSAKFKNAYSQFAGQESCEQHRGADSGNASRFFYTAKADSSERRGSKHPTVKPLDLMRYLVRLVCPIGSTVLDPFMGSGTTIEAARLENCKSIGIERETQYCSDAIKRIRQQVMFVG